MIISTLEIAQLKRELADKFSAELHSHDSCGGQSFSLDKSGEDITEYITAFFAELGVKIKFTPDNKQFYTVKKHND